MLNLINLDLSNFKSVIIVSCFENSYVTLYFSIEVIYEGEVIDNRIDTDLKETYSFVRGEFEHSIPSLKDYREVSCSFTNQEVKQGYINRLNDIKRNGIKVISRKVKDGNFVY